VAKARARVVAAGSAALLVAIAAPGLARASGFLLYEQSATALAKGAAMVASVRDPAASWFNPAALAFVPGAGVALNAAMVMPRTGFTPRLSGSEVESPSVARVIPSLFAHAPLGDRVQAGVAVLAPFGLAVSWPEGWVGAEESLSSALTVLAVNPSLTVRIDDRLSLAAGLSVLRATVSLALALPTPPAGTAALSGVAWGLGANVGLLFRLLPGQLHLGASYRSRARLPFHGDADFSPQMPGFEAILADQGVSAAVTVPDIVAFGVMARPLPQLELSAEVDWVRWSTFRELFIDFDRPGTPDRRIEHGSVNPLTGRFGVEWTWADAGLAARAGVVFDKSSSPAEALSATAPDADRVGLGTGLGWTFGRFSLDAAYFYAYFLPTEAQGPNAHPEGTYRSTAHVLALTLSVHAALPP
jgi:long-chain fatty acid transport protein